MINVVIGEQFIARATPGFRSMHVGLVHRNLRRGSLFRRVSALLALPEMGKELFGWHNFPFVTRLRAWRSILGISNVFSFALLWLTIPGLGRPARGSRCRRKLAADRISRTVSFFCPGWSGRTYWNRIGVRNGAQRHARGKIRLVAVSAPAGFTEGGPFRAFGVRRTPFAIRFAAYSEKKIRPIAAAVSRHRGKLLAMPLDDYPRPDPDRRPHPKARP